MTISAPASFLRCPGSGSGISTTKIPQSAARLKCSHFSRGTLTISGFIIAIAYRMPLSGSSRPRVWRIPDLLSTLSVSPFLMFYALKTIDVLSTYTGPSFSTRGGVVTYFLNRGGASLPATLMTCSSKAPLSSAKTMHCNGAKVKIATSHHFVIKCMRTAFMEDLRFGRAACGRHPASGTARPTNHEPKAPIISRPEGAQLWVAMGFNPWERPPNHPDRP
jgi:hypothetical protein